MGKAELTDERKARTRAYNAEYYAANKDKIKENSATWKKANKKQQLATNAAWQKANPEKMAAAGRKHRYGITQEQYDALFAAQGSVCAICKADTPGARGWHTDHCHETGTVRGILCHSCNVGLGHFRDNLASLTRAIEYLTCHEARQ
jgi:hypothetical protein